MKNFITPKKISLLSILLILAASCLDPHHKPCWIDQFYWEDQWHQAHYNAVGRLTRLQAPTSNVYFHYNAAWKLTKAEIFTTDVTPTYEFVYTQGPLGITEINLYHNIAGNTYHDRIFITYSSPTRVSQIVRQELGTDEVVGFEGTYFFNYTDNNLTLLDAETTGVNTTYTAFSYDNKKNPFRVLAAAVGNPVFFPACRFVNFPVTDYDIPFLSIFSQNNPLTAEYQIDDVGSEPSVQTFDNTYSGGYAKKIIWTDTSFGYTDSEDYEFTFRCHHRSSSEE